MPEEASHLTDRTAVARNVGLALLVVVLAIAVIAAPSANWDFALLGVLLGFAIFSDLTAKVVEDRLNISGSFPALVLAMVFLGGSPAAVMGLVTAFLGYLRWREPLSSFVQNLLNYSLFSLAGGLAFHAMVTATGVTDKEVGFYVLIFGVFCFALAINFFLAALYMRYTQDSPILKQVQNALLPLLPSELMAALMAVGVAFLYVQVGIAAVALFGVVLITFQYLLGALLVSQ
ncbi:MAG: hypothetical protein JST59_25770, partial [Actinobacteria bacterium]|nr:hypothetical protein [Actinomycetota bacterium]